MLSHRCLTKRRGYFITITCSCLVTLFVLRYLPRLDFGLPLLNVVVNITLSADSPSHNGQTEQRIPRPSLNTQSEFNLSGHTLSSETESLATVSNQKKATWQSLEETSISVEEIQMKYDRCRAVSIRSNGQCASVHNDLPHAWKSKAQAGDTRADDFQRMTLASQCCALYYEEIMRPAPKAAMFPWERDYLSTPLLDSLKDIAWSNHSIITILSSHNDNSTCRLGAEVKFRIELFNGRKERRTLGGDKVDVWLVNDDFKASIAADVTDNKDGTYTAVTLLPWSGTVNVKATIAHNMELIRTVLYLQRVFKSTHWFTGTFISSTATEATPCSPFPYLPGYAHDGVCNLTVINEFPWYCGKPVKRNDLNCSHFVSEAKIFYPSYLPMTEAEEELLTMTETKRPFLIPSNISLNVLADEGTTATLVDLPKLSCSQRNLSLTFEENNSYGFFYQGNWRPLACQLPEIDAQFLSTCLKDTKVIFLGDSNSRKQMELLSSAVPCVDKIVKSSVIWHAPLRCDNDAINMSIQYYPHNFPFYGSQKEEVKSDVLYSEARFLESIPGDGKYIVHIHVFLHLIPFHFSIVEQRLKRTREAIESLLKRNPRAIVVYQSAHSAYDRRPMNYHKLGAFLVELQRSTLKGLGERVMFLFTWPMTVAVANNDEHPPISDRFSKYFLGYVCGRQ